MGLCIRVILGGTAELNQQQASAVRQQVDAARAEVFTLDIVDQLAINRICNNGLSAEN